MPADNVLGYAAVGLAVFLLLSVLASKASTKLGIPALLLFMAIGMVAGADGLGIQFDDYDLTATIGTAALALILFAGGLETDWKSIRPVLWSAVSLSTLGVVLTALALAVFAHYVVGLPLMMALLLGAVVSSTDAAAVFGLLRSRGLGLRHRLGPLLEAESGSNDPMAVFLTMTMIAVATETTGDRWLLLPSLLVQMPLGIVFGVVVGRLTVSIINRIRLEYDGLYPVLTLGAAAASFGLAALLGGNEFLAVYVAGIAMGNRSFIHKAALRKFHDGLGWFAQIGMFLILGLLAYPHRLIPIASMGMLFAIFLILVARPLAVFACLAFSGLSVRSKLFVSWAGLRGAVPIVLATFPMVAGVDGAGEVFDLVFFIVLSSVAVQGTLIKPIARWLGVSTGRVRGGVGLQPAGITELVRIRVGERAPAAGRAVVDLGLPSAALLVMLYRGGVSYLISGSTVIEPGDEVLLAAPREELKAVRRHLMGPDGDLNSSPSVIQLGSEP